MFVPQHNSGTELCHGKFQCEKERKFGWDNLLANSWFNQMRDSVEKVDVLIWNKSKVPVQWGFQKMMMSYQWRSIMSAHPQVEEKNRGDVIKLWKLY